MVVLKVILVMAVILVILYVVWTVIVGLMIEFNRWKR
jgi:hypothetical protein